MENEDGEKDTEFDEAELRLKVESLKQELHECRAELSKLQKQLNQSERLQRSTESYNEDLRKQVSAYMSSVQTTVWFLRWKGVYPLCQCLQVFIYTVALLWC